VIFCTQSNAPVVTIGMSLCVAGIARGTNNNTTHVLLAAKAFLTSDWDSANPHSPDAALSFGTDGAIQI
jgi:hypothetical protein